MTHTLTEKKRTFRFETVEGGLVAEKSEAAKTHMKRRFQQINADLLDDLMSRDTMASLSEQRFVA